MKQEFSLLDILKVLGRWKKHIITTTAIIGIISVIGSLTMPNYYQSSTTFYAAHPDLANPDPIGGEQTNKFIYGTGDDLDRLFSVANSNSIQEFLIQKFDLFTHYNIDSTTLKGKAKMIKKFNKNYKTELTKYEAMTLSIEDKDPQIAYEMVVAAREKLSLLVQNILKRSQKKTLDIAYNNMIDQQKSLSSLNDSISILKTKYGIVDSKTQGEVFATMLTKEESSLQENLARLKSMKANNMPSDSIIKIKSIIAGLESKTSNLRKSVSNYTNGILKVLALEGQQELLFKELSYETERYKKLKASYQSPFTTIHIVEKESVPVEKSRPKRSLIVLGLTLMAFLLSCLGALVFDSTKDVDWREIYNGN